jgi:hypothetical protein
MRLGEASERDDVAEFVEAEDERRKRRSPFASGGSRMSLGSEGRARAAVRREEPMEEVLMWPSDAQCDRAAGIAGRVTLAVVREGAGDTESESSSSRLTSISAASARPSGSQS